MRKEIGQCIDCTYFIKGRDWPVRGKCVNKNSPGYMLNWRPAGYSGRCPNFKWRWILFGDEEL